MPLQLNEILLQKVQKDNGSIIITISTCTKQQRLLDHTASSMLLFIIPTQIGATKVIKFSGHKKVIKICFETSFSTPKKKDRKKHNFQGSPQTLLQYALNAIMHHFPLKEPTKIKKVAVKHF